MKLEIYTSKSLLIDVISSNKLHKILELDTEDYSKVIFRWLNDSYGFRDTVRKPINGKDFCTIIKYVDKKKTTHLELSIEFAKLVTLNSRSSVKQHYAQQLLELERKKDNLELLTLKQVVFINKLIQFFGFVSNQKEVLKIHSKKYVAERESKGKRIDELYSFFHTWRNSKLDISQEEVDQRLKEFCLTNQKSVSNFKNSKFDKIFIMDNYETLKHAVWDFMHLKDKSSVAHKIAELTYKIAKESEMPIYLKNEDNLFQSKVNTVLNLN